MGSLVAPANYFESLSLAFDPFADDAMPTFFFVGGQRRYLAQRAVHLLYFSGAMVLVLGASGAGKSRLLNEIGGELSEIADVCRIEATVMTDGPQLRAQLADAIGLAADATVSPTDFLLALRNNRPGDAEPLPVVLLIDSAHLLAIDTLAETVALVQGSGGRLRLLMAGQGELATSWQQADVGAAEVLHLTDLDRQETADYLHTRLQAAGAVVPIPFDSALLDELFVQSGGNIGAIHALVPQLFTPAASAKPLSRRAKSLPLAHIGIIAALLATVIILVLYRGSGPSKTDAPAAAAKPAASGTDQHSVPLALPRASNKPAPEPAIAQAAPEPAETAAGQPIPVPAPVPTSPSQPKRVEPKPAEAPKSASVVKPVAQESVAKPIKEPVEPAYAGDERELLALPATQFMLQLLGAESRATIDKFKASAGRERPLLIYHTQLRGKPWFIVTTGPYPNKAAAQAAIAKMPEVLRKQQPWPRSVANVQADIRAHSGNR
jgi:DamX protein